MPNPELQRINAFLSTFARRQAARTVELPGGFGVFDDAFARSRANNQVVIDADVDPEAVPAIVEEAMGHLPYRMVNFLDDETGAACAEPLVRAGYGHATYVVMLHTGAVPAGGDVEKVDLDAIRAAVALRLRDLLPDADEEVVRQLVDRREARRRGADVVHFLAARTDEGEVGAWADLYLDAEVGVAQVEELVTAQAYLRRGYGDAVLAGALRLAAEAGCGTRFLLADGEDWPQQWYARRGFTVIGRGHGFARV